MLTSNVTIHPAFTVAPVPPRLFGAFVEHMGRSVYGGIFEPGHAAAGPDGTRLDVAELVKELAISVVRYPGGNFVSSYQWEDGVGDPGARPTRLELAWRSSESNAFGSNEFLQWCRSVGAEPMMAVNLGTRGIADACNLLEYLNHPGGSYYSDLRISHGYSAPYEVKLWCLGNEMDGEWQIGHKTAEEYGRLAAETARAMRQIDPTIQLVACGSSHAQMPTFGSWEATVLEHTYDDVDFISLHAYYERGHDDVGTYLASGVALDAFIEGVVATADHIRAKKRSPKQLKLSLDEWNIWGETNYPGHPDVNWAPAPRLIEETYSVEDAVVFGSLLMSMLRHADRLEIGCLAQLVNVIAPIRAEPTGEAWRQTIFHPFALTAQHARGHVLHTEQDAPTYASRHGKATVTDVVATHDTDSGQLAIFAVNRSEDQNVAVHVDLSPFPDMTIAEHHYIGGSALNDVNTQESPDQVVPRTGLTVEVTDRNLQLVLPPVSWTVVRLVPAC